MKKITITGMLMLLGLFLISSGIHATNKESIFDDIVTVMERTTSAGNLPAIIDNAGANRGAGFNGQYVFVASRQTQGEVNRFVYYWDVNNPDAPPQQLDMTGVDGGFHVVNDMTVVGNHIFAGNLVLPGVFKMYHWNGITAQPSLLIEYDSGTARLGDAFTVLGDPDDFALIIVSQHGGKSFYIWAMENGELDFDEPLIVPFDELPADLNFSRVTFPDGEDEFPIISGPAGVFVIGEDNDIVLTIEQSFFPGWPMYAHVFTYEGGRYFAFMHVKDNPAANVMYVLDITEGEDVLEALQILKNGTFTEKVVHFYDMGSVPNGNASVSMDVVIDSFGNLWLMGFAAGNGFVVQRIGDAGPGGQPLPLMETFDGEGEETPDTWLPEGWASFTLDDDGEEFSWYWSPGPAADPNGQMRSQSAYQDDGTWFALNPDNWLVTPQIYMSEISGDEIIELSFKIGTGAQTPGFKLENYSVLISATDTEPDSFTTLWTETLTSDFEQNALYPRELDLSEYAGQDVYLAFRHHDVTDMDRLFLDDVFVQVVIPQDPQFADLTLNVRMIVWEEQGIFDPAEDFVDVAGTFNEWGDEELLLSPLDDEFLTYTITIEDLEVGETYEFKFRINGSWDDETAEFPFGGPAREVTIVDGENIHTFWYNDDEPTTVAEVMENFINLFPNPANSQVQITSDSNIMEVSVYNIAGQQIYRHSLETQNHIINLNDFNNGIYMVRILTREGMQTMKLQVVK
ncbi:MAG: DUF4623 domain-containing protein [Bacteroidetes bacterium]|nr:MAG: DUF4623 domain-containing protein [Bacteroidota bacterium]